MEKKFAMIFIFISSVFCYAQITPNVPYNIIYSMDMNGSIHFLYDNNIKLSFYEPEIFEKKGVFTIDLSKNIPFIDVEWEDKTNERLLIISNENICEIYTEIGTVTALRRQSFTGINGRRQPGSNEIFLMPFADSITASSYLVEGNISYEPNQNSSLLRPLWVEGAPGYGINEKLFIIAKSCFAIHISIGYVSYINPDLYLENSRPKRIQLKIENSFSISIDLDDTPNFQTIYLPRPLRANEIMELEIIDIYHGTKYTDTCINKIYYDYIPWGDINSVINYDYIPWQNWNIETFILDEKNENEESLMNATNNIDLILYETVNINKNNIEKRGLFLLLLIPLVIIIIIILKKRK